MSGEKIAPVVKKKSLSSRRRLLLSKSGPFSGGSARACLGTLFA